MADNNLYGCNWMEFSEFRRQSHIALVNEVDISWTDIVQPDDVGSKNIHSLRELYDTDLKLRQSLGQDEFKLSLQTEDDMQLEWERYDSMLEDLRSRLKSVSPQNSQLFAGGHSSPSSQLIAKARDVVEPLSKEQELTSSFLQPVSQQDRDDANARINWEMERWIPLEMATSLLGSLDSDLDGPEGMIMLTSAPDSNEVASSVGITVNPGPYYSNPGDVPVFPFSYGGKEYRLKSSRADHLPHFKFGDYSVENTLRSYINDTDDDYKDSDCFELGELPPSYQEVAEWHATQLFEAPKISGSYKFHSMPEPVKRDDDLTSLIVEVFTAVRQGQTPVAEHDRIEAIFWGFGDISGIITTLSLDDECHHVESEQELLGALVKLVQHLDPDLLIGYETSKFSWGYIGERYNILFDNVLDVGRLKPGYAFARAENIVHPGRYLLNLWQFLSAEVQLYKYSLESVVYHVLHKTTPHYPFDALYEWWGSSRSSDVAQYFQHRIQLVIELIDHLEIIPKYVEQSRLIGIDFYSSLTRGSQYKVEAVLCRLSKRRKFMLLSPSRAQVGNQAALEWIPLVMEPQSTYYTDPVCVLDFRSLYPSIMMAFNLCYSTCIGRVQLWKGKNKLGVLDDLEFKGRLNESDIFIAPNGIGYVKRHVRKSLLSTMLKEILESRFMIKSSMKLNKGDARYQRNMNGKQLALKLLANVTYGYVSASFSGRMPCAEISDSIVSIGRELLRQSIKIIERSTQWGVQPKVVYGDTDSLFVKLPGVSRAHAFEIGKGLAKIVTDHFPKPIELEMEKVYHPCFLLTKKRYVGRCFDTPDATGRFEAKGTETIRRDGVPLLQRLERTMLEKLFATNDLSLVKSYFQSQLTEVLKNNLMVDDFCFAQKVKLGTYKAGFSNLPGGAVVTLKKALTDKGALPQYKERVSFVVTAGIGNINDRVVSPEEVVNNPNLMIDFDYYVNKVIIPPLERVFNLIGADLKAWYNELPRFNRVGLLVEKAQCVACNEKSATALCAECQTQPEKIIYLLYGRLNSAEDRVSRSREVCRMCTHDQDHLGYNACESLDCSNYYRKKRDQVDRLVCELELEEAAQLI